MHGSPARTGAGRLAAGLGQVLERQKERIVPDLTRLSRFESEATHHLAVIDLPTQKELIHRPLQAYPHGVQK